MSSCEETKSHILGTGGSDGPSEPRHVFLCVVRLWSSLSLDGFLSLQKCIAAKKVKQSIGSKSMSFPTGKSDRYVQDAIVAKETRGGLT